MSVPKLTLYICIFSGTFKVDTGTATAPGEERPAAHLMGSVRKAEQPTGACKTNVYTGNQVAL